jgi:Spy/CpxP family protein refolding chaperone
MRSWTKVFVAAAAFCAMTTSLTFPAAQWFSGWASHGGNSGGRSGGYVLVRRYRSRNKEE